MAEVVRAELPLMAVGSSPVRHRHDPGVVDEHIDGADSLADPKEHRPIESRLPRSHSSTITSAPEVFARIRAAASSPASGRRTARTRRAPRCASTRDASHPIPELAPVITTTLPF